MAARQPGPADNPARPCPCCSRVQTKVRRNGRGGWTKQEVRAAGPQFGPRRAAVGGSDAGRRRRTGATPPSGPQLSAARPLPPQDDLLRRLVQQHGAKNWKKIGALPGRAGRLLRQRRRAAPHRHAHGMAWGQDGPKLLELFQHNQAAHVPQDSTSRSTRHCAPGSGPAAGCCRRWLTPASCCPPPAYGLLPQPLPLRCPFCPTCSREFHRPDGCAVPAPLAEGAAPSVLGWIGRCSPWLTLVLLCTLSGAWHGCCVCCLLPSLLLPLDLSTLSSGHAAAPCPHSARLAPLPALHRY